MPADTVPTGYRLLSRGKPGRPRWLRMDGFGVFLLIFLGFLSGCQQSPRALVSEVDEPDFRRARDFLQQGRNEQALVNFLAVTEKRVQAPQSHLELGRLYLNHFQDPVAAIYHLRRYLEEMRSLQPDDPEIPLAEGMIQAARQDFARTFARGILASSGENQTWVEVVAGKDREIEALKNELARVRSRLLVAETQLRELRALPQTDAGDRRSAVNNGANASVERRASGDRQNTVRANGTPEASVDFYEVQPGDTLSGISLKVYGSRSEWRRIYQENADQLPNPNALKVGMRLKIP